MLISISLINFSDEIIIILSYSKILYCFYTIWIYWNSIKEANLFINEQHIGIDNFVAYSYYYIREKCFIYKVYYFISFLFQSIFVYET